ncbi:hypothetical protein KTH_59660 [Thermosporothrix hazakensis]|nr:hypothetical protein KTH_59660 [Thermosporothrix hazakensis]
MPPAFLQRSERHMQSSVFGQIAEIVGVGCAEMCDGRSRVGCWLSFGVKTRCTPIKQIGARHA